MGSEAVPTREKNLPTFRLFGKQPDMVRSCCGWVRWTEGQEKPRRPVGAEGYGAKPTSWWQLSCELCRVATGRLKEHLNSISTCRVVPRPRTYCSDSSVLTAVPRCPGLSTGHMFGVSGNRMSLTEEVGDHRMNKERVLWLY